MDDQYSNRVHHLLKEELQETSPSQCVFFSSRCTVTWRRAVEAGRSSSGGLTAAWTSRGAGGNTKWCVCVFGAMDQNKG